MDTQQDRKPDSQDEEMTKYAVECQCARGIRPKAEEMTKVAGGYECPACGRKHTGAKHEHEDEAQ